MKRAVIFLVLFLGFKLFSQKNADPIVVVDSKIIGKMNENKNIIENIKSEDVSTVTVFKDSLMSKKYGSDYGVIIITTKKYIINTFYENFIKNTSLKENIKSANELIQVGIIGMNNKSKNQPYDELLNYIYTNTINEKIKKITKITFIKPIDAIKLNENWVNGALEIDSETTTE